MLDYQMMSRFVRGFASLMRADKPTVVKIHGYCVAGGTDIALHADLMVAAADAKIGYPPTRVWGIPAAGLWAHRIGDQRAKRLLFTGDCLFPGGVGKTWEPGGFEQLLGDVRARVFDVYGDDTVVYPGHGDDTTLGEERPHLAEWSERGW